MTFVSTWTDARIERLKMLHADGWSSSQIAADLGDATRNGVIGKIHRLGLVRDGIVKKVVAPRAPREAKPRVQKSRQRYIPGTNRFYEAVSNPAEVKLRCVEIACTVPFADVTGCMFTPDDGPFLFCDGPKQAGSSYCTAHHALCWVKPISNAPKARVYYGTDFAA